MKHPRRQPEVFIAPLLAPNVFAILAAVGLYFGAILVAIRRARWYVSRLLPTVMPGLTMFLVPMVVFGISEVPSSTMFLLLLILATIMGLAAWGSFIRFGESQQVPTSARTSLGAC